MKTDILALKDSLLGFYAEQLQCVPDSDGIHFAWPLLLPDGWQISFSLYPGASNKSFELSDNGTIRDYLERFFPRLTHSVRTLIMQRIKFYGMEYMENGIIRKVLLNSVQPQDLQIFAEGLLSIAYISYRFDPKGPGDNTPFETVRQIFIRTGISYETNVELRGKYHSRIRADFKDRTSILRVIRSKEALSALQITAFQFNDYKMAQPAINRILIYDPDYHWSPECESLARSPEYFEFSAPYQETERIHDYLLSSRAPRSNS